jgi:hypothetical protein
MKSKFAPILNFLTANSFSIWLAFVVGLIITSSVNTSKEYNRALQNKDVEIAELRSKINNHLIAEGFYEKPAKEVLPVMKGFGIGL